MIKFYYILATFLFKLVTSDIEYFNNQDDATYKQPGDFHINKVFYNCSDGATKLWDHLISEIDTNRDGQIDLTEMEIYLNKIILNERKEEAEELIEKLDPSKSGLIGFSSYANETFGSAIIEILAVDDHSENLKELKILYGLEKAKWTNLSSTDEMLNYAKFYEFLFADESPKLKDLEKEISFRAYDTNNDGFLNIDEFTAAIKDYDETIIKESKNKKPSLRQFTNKIDLNGDNQIDLEEFKAWITFPSKQKLIEEEETFLFDSCDLNKNGFLEQHEIEETCSRLVKSQLILNREITSSNKNITKHRHDEL